MSNPIVEEGDKVAIHYVGKVKGGEVFDSSYDRNQPIEFTVGTERIIPGFNKGVMGMKEGEKKEIELSPEEGYGQPSDENIIKVPLKNFGKLPPEYGIGDYIAVQTDMGQMEAKIKEMDNADIVLDFNHRLSGHTLIFEVEVVNIEKAA